MRCLKIFLSIAFLLCAQGTIAQSLTPLQVSGGNDLFTFTVTFTDSTFLFDYADSTDLIRERAEIILLFMFSELMCPTQYLNEADIAGFAPLHSKIRYLESKLIDNETAKADTGRIAVSRNALARGYLKLYEDTQADWIDEEWRGKEK